MSQSTARFNVQVAPEIELSLSVHEFGERPAIYGAGLYRRGSQQLAFTSFELKEARVVKVSSELWIGSTCYELPADSVNAVAAFLSLPVHESLGSAP